MVTSSLTDEDYLTVMTGTNDMTFSNRGQCIGLDMHEEARMNLLSQGKHTNVLVISAPYRYDKPYVNEHISRYNAELESVINTEKPNFKFPTRLQYLDINKYLDSSMYAKTGLHLNKGGKDELAVRIAMARNNFPVGKEAPSALCPNPNENHEKDF